MNQEIIEHIKRAKALGKSDEQIKSDLLWAGWKEKEIDDSLKGGAETLIFKTPHFYSIKSIAALELLFGLYSLYSGVYYFNILLPSKRAELLLKLYTPEQKLYFFAWLATGLLLIILGCLALAGSIQLFRFKKWGLYFTYITLALVLLLNLLIVGWSKIFLLYLAIVAMIFVYLIRQQKFILNLGDSVQTKKDIIKLLVVSGIILAVISAILISLPIFYQKSLLRQEIIQNEIPAPPQGSLFLKTYTNTTYGFSLKYPDNWVIEEYTGYPFSVRLMPREFQKDKRDMALTISPVNVGRESVFDGGAKTNIQNYILNWKKAKLYDCPMLDPCPLQLSYSKSIKLIDLPQNWTDDNEIDYSIRKGYENLRIEFEFVLSHLKFEED